MKVLLVDDHPLIREGLAVLLAQLGPTVQCLQAGSLAEALDQAHVHRPLDLLLLDLGLKDAQGLQGLAQVRAALPELPLVVISGSEPTDWALPCIEAGAQGYVHKTADFDVLHAALERVLAGEVYLPPSVLAGAPPTPPEDELPFTERQLDVLRLLLAGQPNKRICRDLALSESTVKTHLATIFRKLGVNNRTQAVVAAARLRLRLQPVG